jgi:glycosyltransferase involved in cell wall biosynthesis
VVHVASRVDDAGYDFLCAVTAALAQQGVEQQVVLVDDDPAREHASLRRHASLLLIPAHGESGPWRCERRLVGAARELLRAQAVRALHLHGFAACAVSALLVRELNPTAPVYYSPFGSRRPGAVKTVAAAAALAVSRWMRGSGTQHAIASVSSEMPMLGALTRQSVDLVESPTSNAFFEVLRSESSTPLLLAGSRRGSPGGADMFAQIAVLLSEEGMPLRFRWIGRLDDDSAARLHEAGVELIDPADEHERAALLSAGWVFAATGEVRGFPSLLVEAMAAGVPCVAVATGQHRDIVTHGETGYLCESGEELLQFIARLVANPALRTRIGREARARCCERFGANRFRESLFAAYSNSMN